MHVLGVKELAAAGKLLQAVSSPDALEDLRGEGLLLAPLAGGDAAGGKVEDVDPHDGLEGVGGEGRKRCEIVVGELSPPGRWC